MPESGLAKRLARRLFRDYRLNWIVASPAGEGAAEPMPAGVSLRPVDPLVREALRASGTAKVRNSASFAEAGLDGLALYSGDELVSVAHFATPAQYGHGSTWPLAAGQVALIDIATEEAARGQGHAARLIRQAAAAYGAMGTRRLIAFIWWSNTPSLKAFAKAGWRRIGFSIELQARGRWFLLRIPLG